MPQSWLQNWLRSFCRVLANRVCSRRVLGARTTQLKPDALCSRNGDGRLSGLGSRDGERISYPRLHRHDDNVVRLRTWERRG